MNNPAPELDRKIVWQALGNQGSVCGNTALEAAEKFYAKYPRSRSPISVREVISYNLKDQDSGKLIPMITTVFGGKYISHRNITKADYKERLTPVPSV